MAYGYWRCVSVLSVSVFAGILAGNPGPAPALPAHAAGLARVAHSPLPATGRLLGVSCPSRSSCWAVGLTNPGQSSSQLETVHWNGVAWTSVPSPIAGEEVSAGQAPDGLNAFVCPGKNSCWAVGSTARRDLVLHWNGQMWSVESSHGYETLSGVTCVSAVNCWAVGTWLAHSGPYKGAKGGWLSRILHWSGRGWSLVRSPNPARAAAIAGCTMQGGCYSNQLSSVACASVRLCWAVGVSTIQGQQGQWSPVDTSEIVQWNGVRWSAVQAPIPAGNLTTVSCSSKTSCWALGSSAAGQTPPYLLALFWNGKVWSSVPSTTVPPLVPTTGFLAAGRTTMSCRSRADCWLVGVRYPGTCGTKSYPIAIHWGGRAWSDMRSTLPAGALFVGVAPLTARNGWAIGWGSDGQDIFQWNGTRWSSLRQSGSAVFAPAQTQDKSRMC